MKQRAQGFSLIELLIIVAVIGILAAIGSQMFGGSSEKARRASAKTVMLEIQGRQERYQLNNRQYGTLAQLGYGTSLHIDAEGNSTSQGSAFYTITMARPDKFNFTITATPINAQVKDSCGALTLNQEGAKTPANCW